MQSIKFGYPNFMSSNQVPVEPHNTAIHLAIRDENIERVTSLLSQKASLFEKNAEGFTSYQLAIASTNPDIAELCRKHVQNILIAANRKFFNFERNKNPKVDDMGYRLNRITMGYEDGKIDITGLPARSIILARSAPYCVALARIGNDMSYFSGLSGKKSTIENIVSTFNWRNDDLNACWPRFTLVYDQTEIKFQMNPNFKQIANFMLSGVGSYGKEILDILSIFTTHGEKSKPPVTTLVIREAALAKLIVNAMKTGQGITKLALKNAGLYGFSRQINITRLNKFIHLVGVEETQRRLYPFYDNDEEFDALPMGIAVAMAFQLIAIKQLSFSQVFNKDENNFGPFTSDTINSEAGVKLFYEKMERLIIKYFEHFPEKASTKEGMHQILIEFFGGDADSDGEPSDSEDEETETIVSLHEAVLSSKPKMVKTLLRRVIDIDAQDDEENTALNLAVKNKETEIVGLLLDAGADCDIPDESGYCPLYYANSDAHFLIYEKLINAGAKKIQKDGLFDSRIYEVDKYGQSSLHIALEEENRPLYLYLINHLPKMLNLEDNLGQTALLLAVKKENIEACEAMLQSNVDVPETVLGLVEDIIPSTHRIHTIFASFGHILPESPRASI